RFFLVALRRVVRFAVLRRPVVLRRAVVLRRVVVLRPRLAVLRLAVVRLAVALRRPVDRFVVVLRPLVAFLAVVRRRVVLFRPPPMLDDEPLIGDGGGGVGLVGSGVGQTEPGSFCADQSVPWSSCVMVPPRNDRQPSCGDGVSNSARNRKHGNSSRSQLVYGSRGDRRTAGPY